VEAPWQLPSLPPLNPVLTKIKFGKENVEDTCYRASSRGNHYSYLITEALGYGELRAGSRISHCFCLPTEAGSYF